VPLQKLHFKIESASDNREIEKIFPLNNGYFHQNFQSNNFT